MIKREMKFISTKKYLSLRSARRNTNDIYNDILKVKGLNTFCGIGVHKLVFPKSLQNVETDIDFRNDFGFFKIFKCRYYVVSMRICRR